MTLLLPLLGLSAAFGVAGCGGTSALSRSSPVDVGNVLPALNARTRNAPPTVLFAFNSTTGSPLGYIVSDGAELYGVGFGTTSSTAFALKPGPSGYALERAYQFQGGYYDAQDVAPPLAPAPGQVVYGASAIGGEVRFCNPPDGCGVVFELAPSHATYKSNVLYRFQGGNDGQKPTAGIVRDAAGALYGTTVYGGTSPVCPYGCGTVFKLTPAGSGFVESVLYSFAGGADGRDPVEPVIVDAAGAIYGSAVGGAHGAGVVFKLTPQPSGGYSESTLYAFRGGSDGNGVASQLVEDERGNLYGVTGEGGNASCPQGSGLGCGTVFRLSGSGERYRKRGLYSFGGTDGAFPDALTLKKGTLYGATQDGGTSDGCYQGCGTIFSLRRSSGEYTEHTVYSFASDSLATPLSGLLASNDGLIGEAFFSSTGYGAVFGLSY